MTKNQQIKLQDLCRECISEMECLGHELDRLSDVADVHTLLDTDLVVEVKEFLEEI